MPNVQVNATISARDAASKNIKKVNAALGTLGNTARSIGSDFRKLGLGAIGLAAGVGAFTASAIKDAAADEAATAKLNAALKARGLATESVLAAVERQIVAGQKLAFTDDEVRASVEASTRFTKNYSQATKIQNVAMELARSTGMSLADATIQVGKAYQGNGGKLLKTLGIEAKAIKGQQALNAILGKTKGSAAAYADTVEGSFQVLAIGAQELKEQFGDAFLPAVGKLFKGLAPYIERFSKLIAANTPKLQVWADTIVNKILANLPALFSKFERFVPKALKSVEGFVDKISGIGKEADGLLGPGGSITLLVTGIGAAFGGLKGAITANLVKDGMDPFTALVVANIAAQIPASLAAALTSAIVNQAIAAYGAKMAAATVLTNTVPTKGGSPLDFIKQLFGFGAPVAAGTAVTAGGAAATTGVAAAAATAATVAAAAVIPVAAFAVAYDHQTKMADAFSNLITRLDLKNRTTPLITAPTGTDSQSELVRTLFFSGYKPPVTATDGTTTNNIYIGTGKVDTVVSDSLTRLGRRGRNQ
jgi:hypothetical protein